MLYEDGVVDPEQQKTFVVAVRDCEDGDEAELEKLVGERLKAIWAAAVKPEVSIVSCRVLVHVFLVKTSWPG